MNQRDYNTVILAGLLHDFGKFLVKPTISSKEHERLGIEYWRERAPALETKTGIDAARLLILIGAKAEDPLWALVKAADGVASGERESTPGGARDPSLLNAAYYPLDCIFASVNLSETGSPIPPRYVHKPLVFENLANVFPVRERLPKKEEASSIEEDIRKMKEEFDRALANLLSDFPEADPIASFRRLHVTLVALFQRYLWCFPGDVQQERETDIRDISLFDHSRLASAAAASLYLYHDGQGTLANAAAIWQDDAAKFLLIGGDLSGIQDYLYEIATIGAGGAAKRLRARSFFLSALVEVIAHRALHSLADAELPLACRIFSAGGRFTLLAPNLPGVVANLGVLEADVNAWLVEEFQGELAFTFASAELAGRDFAIPAPTQTGQSTITQKLTELDDRLAARKTRKSQSALTQDGMWMSAFRREWRGAGEQTACESCHKFLAPKASGICPHCQKDSDLGAALANAQWVAYWRGHADAAHALRFFEGADTYSVVVYATLPERFERVPFLVEKIGTKPADIIAVHAPAVERFVANYVPHKGDEIRDFEWIAEQSKGESLLGVLKADVDRLGMIFALGLDHASLSRIATLSRMLDLFFGGWLNRCVEKEFKNCYVVYAGGDDLLVVGPWDETARLAIRLNSEFRRYTANNNWITLSAGIAVVKDRFPIAKSSKLAGEFLKRAKEGEDKGASRGNRLRLFSTTIAWNDLPPLLEEKDGGDDYAHFLWDRVKTREDDLGKKRGFLHRLLIYSNACIKWNEAKRSRDLLYRAHLVYDIARNVVRVEQGKIVNGDVVEKLRRLSEPGQAKLMARMRLPVTWAIFKSRRQP